MVEHVPGTFDDLQRTPLDFARKLLGSALEYDFIALARDDDHR